MCEFCGSGRSCGVCGRGDGLARAEWWAGAALGLIQGIGAGMVLASVGLLLLS